MPVAVRSSGPDESTNPTTSFVVTIPADVEAGDFLYVVAEDRGATDAAPETATCTDDDTGGNPWSLLASAHIAGDNGTGLVWGKRATSGSAGKTVTVANCSNSTSGGIAVASGPYAAGDPTTNMMASEQVGGVESVAGFTPDYPDSLIFFCIMSRDELDFPTGAACDDPGDLEPELWQASSTGGLDCIVTLFAKVQTGGPTATGNFVWAQPNRSTYTFRWAVRPEVSGGFVPFPRPRGLAGGAHVLSGGMQ